MMELSVQQSTQPMWGELAAIALLRGGYNTTTVILGTTILGLAAGVVGVFALLRKRSLTTDALSHATLPGIALAFLLAGALGLEGRSLPILLLGAGTTGVLGMLCILGILRGTRLREDAAIGIVLSVFFGAGIVLLSIIQAHAAAGSAGLTGFIYGQAATMGEDDVLLMSTVAALACAAAALLLKEFTLVCFDQDFARVDGWPIDLIDMVILALIVLVTVAGLQAVGLIMVVALLIIPAVAARFWSERVLHVVMLAGLIGAASGYTGSVMSALLPRKPAGAVIVLCAGGLFLLSMLLAPRRGVLATGVRRLRVRARLAGDHLLEAACGSGAELSAVRDLSSAAARRGWGRAFTGVVAAWLWLTGCIQRREGGWRLTPRGLARGRRVGRNHALWTQYLISHADIAPTHVDWSVDQVEHVLSPELVAELERALAARRPPR